MHAHRTLYKLRVHELDERCLSSALHRLQCPQTRLSHLHSLFFSLKEAIPNLLFSKIFIYLASGLSCGTRDL